MADITKYPFICHLRSDTSVHIQHLSNGRSRHDGPGIAFWYRPATAALAEIPLDDRQQTLLFHARTADFQDVTVQATVTYRVIDPTLAATRIAFDIDPITGSWIGNPLETLAGLLKELAQQPAIEQVAAMTVTDALANGITPIRQQVAAALAGDERLAERGLTVTDVRVVAVKADPELERALQTETRERVQQEADKATFERRALAVENERAIAENELQNQIELSRREETLVNQQGQNDRQRATNKAAAGRIETEARVSEQRLIDEAQAAGIRQIGEADAEVEAAKLKVFEELDQSVLMALAARDLANNIPRITSLTVTPDLLTSALQRFTAQPTRPTVAASAAREQRSDVIPAEPPGSDEGRS